MGCWDIVERLENDRVMHINFVLKRAYDEKEAVCKHINRLVVCGNEGVDCPEDTFIHIANYLTIKLIFCLSARRGWTARHIDFENDFPNEQMERVV